MNIGESIRKIRKIKGLTMKELGNKVGLSEQGIGNYERGDRKPNIEIIDKIAKVLEVTTAELIGDENQTEYIKSMAKETAKKEVNTMYSVIEYVNENYTINKYDLSKIINTDALLDISGLIKDVTLNRLRHYGNIKSNNSNDDKSKDNTDWFLMYITPLNRSRFTD